MQDPAFESELDRRSGVDFQNRSKGIGWLIPLKINVDLWEHTLTSITGYARLDDLQGGDIDGTAADYAEFFREPRSPTCPRTETPIPTGTYADYFVTAPLATPLDAGVDVTCDRRPLPAHSLTYYASPLALDVLQFLHDCLSDYGSAPLLSPIPSPLPTVSTCN